VLLASSYHAKILTNIQHYNQHSASDGPPLEYYALTLLITGVDYKNILIDLEKLYNCPSHIGK